MSTRRTSFHFPEKAVEQLRSIQRRSRLDSGADVIRVALAAYDELLRIALGGYKILVRDQSGREWLYSPYTKFTYPGLDTHAITPPIQDEKPPKNFFFSGEAVERLESIRKRSRAQSNADAIRMALSAYDELLGVIAAGDTIIIQDKQGNEQSYSPYAPLAMFGEKFEGL